MLYYDATKALCDALLAGVVARYATDGTDPPGYVGLAFGGDPLAMVEQLTLSVGALAPASHADGTAEAVEAYHGYTWPLLWLRFTHLRCIPTESALVSGEIEHPSPSAVATALQTIWRDKWIIRQSLSDMAANDVAFAGQPNLVIGRWDALGPSAGFAGGRWEFRVAPGWTP